MAPDVFRVKYSLVLPGYEGLEPPSQPQGWDADNPAVLGTGFGYMFLWPKKQIRLGTEGRGTTPEAAQPAHEDIEMAQNPTDNDEIDEHFGDQFLNTKFGDDYEEQGCQFTQKVVEPQTAPGPSAKPTCQVRLFPSSQETPPPVAFTEPQRPAPMISPNTLHRAVGEEIAVVNDVVKCKKGRKRKPKAASQGPKPIRAQDGPAENPRKRLHEAGTPMLSDSMLLVAGSHMRSIHHGCLFVEGRRIRERDQSYLVYKAKVPNVPGFVAVAPGDIFYVRHTDIFDMLNGFRLHDTLVRLFSLNMAMQIIRDKTPGIAIVDPYFMRDAILRTHEDVHMATDYLSSFLETNSGKDVILMPYHPESESGQQHCVLICLNVNHSSALYLDSGSATRKNYSTIKRVLDDALNGYVAAGGAVPSRPVKKYGMHVFSHKMEFSCVKQPSGSEKDAFYALHHMKAFVRDAQNTTLPSDLRQWAEDLGRIQDRNLRMDFFDTQEELSTIIHQQVIKTGGVFHGGNPPPNKDIDKRLAEQRDGRTFMTLAKGAPRGFINVPKPTHQPEKS